MRRRWAEEEQHSHEQGAREAQHISKRVVSIAQQRSKGWGGTWGEGCPNGEQRMCKGTAEGGVISTRVVIRRPGYRPRGQLRLPQLCERGMQKYQIRRMLVARVLSILPIRTKLLRAEINVSCTA